ncbi:MAG: hypothetical protein ACLQF0_12480 [Dissulfurispiraceae bacterium]
MQGVSKKLFLLFSMISWTLSGAATFILVFLVLFNSDPFGTGMSFAVIGGVFYLLARLFLTMSGLE